MGASAAAMMIAAAMTTAVPATSQRWNGSISRVSTLYRA